MFGDPMIFKVERKANVEKSNVRSYEVVDVCYDPCLVGMFIQRFFHPSVQGNVQQHCDEVVVEIPSVAADGKCVFDELGCSKKRKHAQVLEAVEEVDVLCSCKVAKLEHD